MKNQIAATPSFLKPEYKVSEFEQRLERLEQKVFKNKKPQTTLNQQILLLHHLGMLDRIRELDISNVQKAQFLALMLNSDASNTKKALESLARSKKSDLRIPFNYEFLRETFDAFDLHDLSQEMNVILTEIAPSEMKNKKV